MNTRFAILASLMASFAVLLLVGGETKSVTYPLMLSLFLVPSLYFVVSFVRRKDLGTISKGTVLLSILSAIVFIVPGVCYAEELTNLSMPLPAVDPTQIEKGDVFEMTAVLDIVGNGAIPNVTIYWEYCGGSDCSTFTTIPIDGSGGLRDTSNENPTIAVRTRITHLIEGLRIGSYEVRCRAYDHDNDIEKATLSVTIDVTSIDTSSLEDWPTFGGKNERDGWSTSFAPDYSKYASTGLVEEISLEPNEWVDGSPIIKNNTLYVSSNKKLYACDLANNEMLWNVSLSGRTWSTPAIVSETICHSDRYKVTCRNAIDGDLIWNYGEENQLFHLSSPLIHNGKVWIGSKSYTYYTHPCVYSFNLTTGELISRYTVPSDTADGAAQFTTSPTISDGRVYVGVVGGNRGGFLLALNESDGTQLLWNYAFMSTVQGSQIAPWYSPPSVHGNKVFMALEDEFSTADNPSFLQALNKYDGSLIWRANMTADQRLERSIPVVYAGKVIVASTDWTNSYVYAFNETNGNMIWQSDVLDGSLWASPSVAEGKVIIGMDAGQIYALNSETGLEIWSYATDAMIYSTPSIYNGDVFFGTENSVICRLRSKTLYTNTSVNLASDAITTLDAKESNTLLEISANSDATGTIGIKKYPKNPRAPGVFGFGDTTLKKCMAIKDPDELQNSMDWAFVKFYYTDDEVLAAGLDESSLALYHWNAIAESWESGQCGVNVDENYVWANVTAFMPARTPGKAMENLIDDVEAMNLQQGIDNSLDTKLEHALSSLEAFNADQRNDTINKLHAFINQVEAQRGDKITNEQADYLIAEAQRIIGLIEG